MTLIETQIAQMHYRRNMEGEFLYKELTEKIIASCFKVHNQIGYGYPEKIYQKALELELHEKQIKYKREVYSKILFDGKIAGKLYLDFLVDDKVAVELKVRRDMHESDWIQLLNYLKATGIRIGILAVFTKHKVEIKRIAN